jgi:peptide/nickel transport system permease protein
MIVAIIVGVTFGLLAGRYRDTWIDGSGRLFGIVIYAMPVFFLGLMAQLFFGSYLGWLPTSDRASPIVEATMETHTGFFTVDSLINGDWNAFTDSVKHLGASRGHARASSRQACSSAHPGQRASGTMKDDYIEAARARGIDERSVVYDHAFRNALVPVITVVGLTVALLLSGAVLTRRPSTGLASAIRS